MTTRQISLDPVEIDTEIAVHARVPMDGVMASYCKNSGKLTYAADVLVGDVYLRLAVSLSSYSRNYRTGSILLDPDSTGLEAIIKNMLNEIKHRPPNVGDTKTLGKTIVIHQQAQHDKHDVRVLALGPISIGWTANGYESHQAKTHDKEIGQALQHAIKEHRQSEPMRQRSERLINELLEGAGVQRADFETAHRRARTIEQTRFDTVGTKRTLSWQRKCAVGSKADIKLVLQWEPAIYIQNSQIIMRGITMPASLLEQIVGQDAMRLVDLPELERWKVSRVHQPRNRDANTIIFALQPKGE